MRPLLASFHPIGLELDQCKQEIVPYLKVLTASDARGSREWPFFRILLRKLVWRIGKQTWLLDAYIDKGIHLIEMIWLSNPARILNDEVLGRKEIIPLSTRIWRLA